MVEIRKAWRAEEFNGVWMWWTRILGGASSTMQSWISGNTRVWKSWEAAKWIAKSQVSNWVSNPKVSEAYEHSGERVAAPEGIKALLIIYYCENVKSLPEGIMRNCNLEQLNIWGCSSLTSFPSGELPSTLKFLVISNCGNLELLPDHMPNLTLLSIHRCKGLKHHHL